MNARADARPVAAPRVSLVRIAVIAGLALVVFLVIGAAAIALTANSGGTAAGLPDGTQTFSEPNHDHVTGTVTYDRVPPAGGAHNATPLNCGVYSEQVANEYAVHSLEHGAVWITYLPTLSPDQLGILQQVATSNYVGTERYVILSPYSGLPSPIVVSAWGAQLRLQSPSDTRLVAFIHHFAGGGQGGEQGGPCTGGLGSPVE
jgi:hypothetical protein